VNAAGAAEWYAKAAQQGNAEAQYELAELLARGQSVPKDFATALEMYKKAADQGDALAQAALGDIFVDPKLGRLDYSQVHAADPYRDNGTDG